MNFHELRIIVGQIKKNIQCPKCKGAYNDESLEHIGNLGDEQSFFHAICIKCEAESIINVTLQYDNEVESPNLTKLGGAPRMKHISANEVLDMHNFLKGFNGDFSKEFKQTRTP